MTASTPMTDQIRRLLSAGWKFPNSEAVVWASRKLGRPVKSVDEVTFDELFDVREDDILGYVRVHGWDETMVRAVNELPAPDDAGLEWLLLPTDGSRWPLARFGSLDRNLWNEWTFASEEERARFVIRELVQAERSRWGPKTIIEPPRHGHQGADRRVSWLKRFMGGGKK